LQLSFTIKSFDFSSPGVVRILGFPRRGMAKPKPALSISHASSISTNTPPQSLGCKNTTGLP